MLRLHACRDSRRQDMLAGSARTAVPAHPRTRAMPLTIGAAAHSIIRFAAADPRSVGVHLYRANARQSAGFGKARLRARNPRQIERQLAMEVGALRKIVSDQARRAELGKRRRYIRFRGLQFRRERAW